uniref:PiggyBac transposable element-derived protein domain-containing protein n=1 Tax=Amphimedon queenslandica TaxID=400682 RepID=A0A1X7VE73_AMPQE
MISVKRVMMILMAISRTQTVVMIVKNMTALAGPSATTSHCSSLPSQTLAGPSATASHYSSLPSQNKTVLNVLHILFIAYTLIALAGPSATASHSSTIPSQTYVQPSATVSPSIAVSPVSLRNPSIAIKGNSPIDFNAFFDKNVKDLIDKPLCRARYYGHRSTFTIMGVVGFPTQRSYWSTKWPFNCDMFKGIITGRQFELLMR